MQGPLHASFYEPPSCSFDGGAPHPQRRDDFLIGVVLGSDQKDASSRETA